MATFPPIDMAIAQPAARFIRDPETRRAPRRHLLSLVDYDGSHHYPYCWGYTIFRTVYTPGSDEAFAKAIERLAIYAKAFADEDIFLKPLPNEEAKDPLPNQELWNRYYSEVVDDPETLANATVNEVGRRFDDWINEHITPRTHSRRDVPNSRFRFCLMLDQESIDHILAMSEDPHIKLRHDPHKFDRWVKVITDEQRPEGDRLWLRVGINGFLWLLWFDGQDPDFILEDYGWVDEDGVLNFRGLSHVR